MESSHDTNNNTKFFNHASHSSPSSSPTSSPPPTLLPSPPAILSPCAACKILRRRCIDKCVLAPYFPPTEPLKFTTAHRVFGASNIIKFLQELPENQRADAVSSMVYEANARIRDPVYGCAGAIFQLQKQVCELQAQVARAQGDFVNLQSQHANLISLLCMDMEMGSSQQQCSPQLHGDGDELIDNHLLQNDAFLLDDCSNVSLWEEILSWT